MRKVIITTFSLFFLLTITAQLRLSKALAADPPCEQGYLDPNGTCKQIQTGFGFSISTEPSGFVASFFSLILGLSGGIALIFIIISGYKLMISRGNPEKIQGARQSLTAAIVGLLFIIFSLVILEVIGVDILRLPGFN